MPNNLKVSIEILLGKDKRENKFKLINAYHLETHTHKKKKPFEFTLLTTFILKHPPQSLVFCAIISLIHSRIG